MLRACAFCWGSNPSDRWVVLRTLRFGLGRRILVFSVLSCYEVLTSRYVHFSPPNCFDFVLKCLWKVEVPLKCKTFGWRCFNNRIPTKDSLAFRGIISPPLNLACVFCEGCGESSSFVPECG